MDWKKTFNLGNIVIHAIIGIAFILAVASTFYALRLYQLQQTQDERESKISTSLEKLKIEDSFSIMAKSLAKAQPELANDKLRELSGILAELEEILEVNLSNKLSHSLRQFSKLINKNSEVSSPSEVLKVLVQKIASLREFSDKNNYKNILSISENLEDKISRFKPSQMQGEFFINTIKNDLKKIELLVNNSALSDPEKSNILNRLNSLNSEIQLLSLASLHLKDLNKYTKDASLSLKEWIIDIESKVRNYQHLYRSKQNHLIILLASLISFILIGWIGLAYLFRWQKFKISEHIENEVKIVIEKGILSDQRFMTDHYSENMRYQIIALLDELKMKLNLGTMLHEGLPFAGCLIDSHFKLTWSNKLFSEQFKINDSSMSESETTWEEIKKLLNFDGDPIYEALVNKVSGIYSIKIRPDENKEMKPYEMYVTPITVNREERVMLFFYPLLSVKDAIKDQVDNAKDTIQRFVELWSEDKLSIEQLQLLEKDFNVSELEELYKIFVNFYQRHEDDKKETALAIDSLEKENSNYSFILDEIKKIEQERKEIIKSEFTLAENIRDNFISTFDKTDQLIHLNKAIMQFNDDLKNDTQKIHQISSELINKGKETREILQHMDSLKSDYKKIKLDLLEIKTKLVSLHSNLMAQLPVLDDHQQKLVHRYKDELAKLDINVNFLEKKLSQLDVFIGKLTHMYIHSIPEQMHFNFNTTQKDHEIKEAFGRIKKELSEDEEQIIITFKELHQLMRKEISKGQAISQNIQIEDSIHPYS